MSFLNPLVLLGLVAAAIPLIIHLFNFRRPRKVDFSSLAFVKELQKTTMQRVRIKQWLLLLLRTLAIAFLVLAFARPTLTGEMAGAVGGRVSSSVALVIDNSLSMTLRDASGEYLRQAKDVASDVVGELRGGDETFLLATASTGSPNRFSSVGAALEAIRNVEPAMASRSIPETVRRAADVLATATHVNREIYVITDLQRSALADTVAVAMPDDVQVYLIPVGGRPHSNVGVADVDVESRIIEVGQPVRITASLINYGSEPIEDYVASVFLEGQRVAQTTADLAPNVPTSVAFTATPQSRGWLSGVVRVEDDAFEFDNERFFTLHVPERRRILIVQGQGQEVDYVRLALSPELARGRLAFDVTVIPETDLAAAGLGEFDAVFLVGPRSLSSGEIASLERYVSAGGGLLLTPGAGAQADDYNALLQALGAGQFSGFSGSLGSEQRVASMEQVDLEHPLFDGVFVRHGLREDRRVESPEVYYAMNYTSAGGMEQTLLGLSNGFPLLQEIRHGLGVAMLLAVAPTVQWSDLPVRGLFVPLMYRSMYYLSASESTAGEQLTVAQDGELRLAGISEVDQVRLIGPDGMEYVPEQRSLYGAMLLRIEGNVVRTPGIYDVRSGTRLLRRVAFNIDAAESDLSVYAPGEGRARLAEATGAPVDLLEVDAELPFDVIRSLSAQRTGVELWNVFLLLALLALVAETVVARTWRPEEARA